MNSVPFFSSPHRGAVNEESEGMKDYRYITNLRNFCS